MPQCPRCGLSEYDCACIEMAIDTAPPSDLTDGDDERDAGEAERWHEA